MGLSNDAEFSAACHAVKDRVFPTADRNGPVGEVLCDAEFLREILARYGGCKLWSKAYREVLNALAEIWQQVLKEADDALSVGHSYPLEPEDTISVPVLIVRQAAKLVGKEHRV